MKTLRSLGDTQFWRTPEPLFYVIGYCSIEGTSATRSRVHQSLGNSLVGVHPITLARVERARSRSREEKFRWQTVQKIWRISIENNRFEQQTFPIAAMFACSCYVCIYLS